MSPLAFRAASRLDLDQDCFARSAERESALRMQMLSRFTGPHGAKLRLTDL